ncbi:MAG TPA: cytochrome C oxidase subunit IV family protein [Pirellulales bacterium]|nr:cytochrome C oxidase subunit IV family protein [Pirellulales bacterium]
MSHAPSTHEQHGGHEHGAHDHGGMAKYVYVFFALCFLTTLSFLTYSDYWPQSLARHEVKRMFMMAVSCTKAMLVILFFMHVKYEANWKYVLTIPASMMSIFLMLALVPDVGARVHGMFGYGGSYSPERLEYVGKQADVDAMKQATMTVIGEHGAEHEGGAHEPGSVEEGKAVQKGQAEVEKEIK